MLFNHLNLKPVKRGRGLGGRGGEEEEEGWGEKERKWVEQRLRLAASE